MLGCVVMASGIGERFGGNKLLVDFAGKPLLSWLLDALPRGLATILVTRSAEVQVLAQSKGVETLLHAEPDVSDTIRLGLSRRMDMDGCLFCVGDQPLLTHGTITRVMRAFEKHPDHIVRAAYGARPGNPVCFPKELYPQLLSLQPGETGGAVARRYPQLMTAVEAAFPEELDDIDTREALTRLEAVARARAKEVR